MAIQIEEQIKEIKEFKDMIYTEYADFFKNRKRIKAEILSYTADTSEKVNKFQMTLDMHSQNLEFLNRMMPYITEILNLTCASQQ